ncbi:MAG: hypothetical protein OXM61_16700 [Candidatus Poribacteria bacterium]|nr:hypothetical protein [Candidatus Poribacteria bacterium]
MRYRVEYLPKPTREGGRWKLLYESNRRISIASLRDAHRTTGKKVRSKDTVTEDIVEFQSC